jgi:hypothetical protein
VTEVLDDIKRLLWFEWDPIGLNQQADWPDDEYDSYAKQVHAMLLAGRDHFAISEYLERSALVDIGVSKSVNHEAIAARALAIFGSRK